MTDAHNFDDLTYESFRRMASDPTLSRHERVGFPDHYREGKELAIFEDIRSKLPLLMSKEKVVLEIGPGCSALPVMLVETCREQRHRLVFVDSEEMLAHLPADDFIDKRPGRFPHIPHLMPSYAGRVDVILTYSVIQYEFSEGNIWGFLDESLRLLAAGGQMLVGDIPNISMRKRFFASEEGVRHHQEFTGSDERPAVQFNVPEPGRIDDSVVLALLARARAAGFNAWVMPQALTLPMANRREDVLIRRP